MRAAAGSAGYINNSLEGTEFDADSTLTGQIIKSFGTFFPNWYFFEASGGPTSSISTISILNGICTVRATGTIVSYLSNDGYISSGDNIAINGVSWGPESYSGADDGIPFINGTWVIHSVTTTSAANDTFTFEINAPDTPSFAGYIGSGYLTTGPCFEIRDNRATGDARGMSFTSVLFTPKEVYRVGELSVGYNRILPSDLYSRFKFQTGSDTVPQGGINSNLFNVLDPSGNNIKPVLWAYFFGYCDATITSRPTATQFEIAFNSHAAVLRPTGDGSKLEFAIVKFNWGVGAGTWSSVVGTDWFNKYTISGTDLGYLISTNPAVGTDKVTELAKSDSFTYNSELPLKFNLKIAIRKHLLSDSSSDNTYLVNLMINDNYDTFGPGVHYASTLHAYIAKPDPTFWTMQNLQPADSMLMPMMYFKFVNVDAQYVNADTPFDIPPNPGSSRIIQDSLFFRQVNAAALNNAGKSYLY